MAINPFIMTNHLTDFLVLNWFTMKLCLSNIIDIFLVYDFLMYQLLKIIRYINEKFKYVMIAYFQNLLIAE